MDQFNPSLHGFIATKKDCANIQRIREEFAVFKQFEAAFEKAHPCDVPLPLPNSPSPTAPKPLSVAELGSCGLFDSAGRSTIAEASFASGRREGRALSEASVAVRASAGYAEILIGCRAVV